MVMIEIDGEVADRIVCETIKESYEYLQDEKFAHNLYSLDVYENHMQVHFLKESMKRVYEYFSTDKLE
jgi:hypothetical protein